MGCCVGWSLTRGRQNREASATGSSKAEDNGTPFHGPSVERPIRNSLREPDEDPTSRRTRQIRKIALFADKQRTLRVAGRDDFFARRAEKRRRARAKEEGVIDTTITSFAIPT